MLVRLMYASRAAAGVDAEELANLLRQSRSGNAASGITGLLCLSDGVFIQLIEGGRDSVSRLYNRIAQDSRHTDVQLLHFEEVTERRFSGWTMGRIDMSRINTALLLKYSEKATLDPYSMSGSAVIKLFEELLATSSVTGDRA